MLARPELVTETGSGYKLAYHYRASLILDNQLDKAGYLHGYGISSVDKLLSYTPEAM